VPPTKSARSRRTPGSAKRSRLGARLRAIRESNGLGLTKVAELSGISRSTLYKVENSGVSLTYDKLVALSRGLRINIEELFAEPRNAGTSSPLVTARRSVERAGEGTTMTTHRFTTRYLCGELRRKLMIPAVTEMKVQSLDGFGPLWSHPGEKFLYVLDGAVEVHTEYYDRVRLEAGDAIYLDSTMMHAYFSVGKKNARTLIVTTSHEIREQ